MAEDPLSYESLVEHALRGVVRRALEVVAEQGLPGDHHFHITFRTDSPGVEISKVLRLQYPEEMTIVLQHMFWDLEVGDESFSVALSFNNVRQALVVPFDAVTIFQDRSVGFVLQFDGTEESDDRADEGAEDSEAPAGRHNDEAQPSESETGARVDDKGGAAGDNIVPLDTFRKK